MQPIIGISMSYDKDGLIREGVDYSYIRREYGAQVRAVGGQPIFIDNSIDPAVAAQLCDGIIISGGEDIEPAFYEQNQLLPNKLEPRERTEWEQRLITAYDREKVHILGICYGSQLLNVHYGGTLFQDIPTETASQLDHGSSAGSVMQRVQFKQDFLSFQKGDSVETAHRHHQAVRDIAPGFSVVASASDGVIEAIAGHGHFGIQWHAESDGTANDIYSAFISLCAGDEARVPFVNSLPEVA